MRFRIGLSHFLLRVSRFTGILPIAVMRPADMAEFSRLAYDRNSGAYNLANDPGEGLTPEESHLLERSGVGGGRILILGAGGGREVVSFASRGFSVVGLDFSEGMLAQARDFARRSAVEFEARLGDLARFEADGTVFDVIWFSMFLYSAVLGRERRVSMLRRLAASLRPGGVVVCSYAWDPRRKVSRRTTRLLRAVAWLTFGNRQIEAGDILLGTTELRHIFSTETELRAEFAASDLEVLDLTRLDGFGRGSAILRRPESRPA